MKTKLPGAPFAALDEKRLSLACKKLARADSDLASIFQTYGTPPLWKREATFATLVHIILEQQVSVASALSAFNKLKEKIVDVTPENVLRLRDEEFRAAYFSRQKTIYVKDLASAVRDGRLNLQSLENLPDDAVKDELKKIKGIGDWTADIYLLMALGRPDLMPRGDLALHVAWRKLKNLEGNPTADEFLKIAERWTPLRAVAARLLWHFYLSEKTSSRAQILRNTKAVL
jgi:DNA-3-methyladenine glycosylase II